MTENTFHKSYIYEHVSFAFDCRRKSELSRLTGMASSNQGNPQMCQIIISIFSRSMMEDGSQNPTHFNAEEGWKSVLQNQTQQKLQPQILYCYNLRRLSRDKIPADLYAICTILLNKSCVYLSGTDYKTNKFVNNKSSNKWMSFNCLGISFSNDELSVMYNIF